MKNSDFTNLSHQSACDASLEWAPAVVSVQRCHPAVCHHLVDARQLGKPHLPDHPTVHWRWQLPASSGTSVAVPAEFLWHRLCHRPWPADSPRPSSPVHPATSSCGPPGLASAAADGWPATWPRAAPPSRWAAAGQPHHGNGPATCRILTATEPATVAATSAQPPAAADLPLTGGSSCSRIARPAWREHLPKHPKHVFGHSREGCFILQATDVLPDGFYRWHHGSFLSSLFYIIILISSIWTLRFLRVLNRTAQFCICVFTLPTARPSSFLQSLEPSQPFPNSQGGFPSPGSAVSNFSRMAFSKRSKASMAPGSAPPSSFALANLRLRSWQLIIG